MDTSQAITIASVVARAGLKNLSDFTFCSFGNLVLLVLAFFDSSLLNCHFWPFTGVLRKIFGSLTREVWEFLHTPQIARMTRIGSWLASAAADPLQLDADWACPAVAPWLSILST